MANKIEDSNNSTIQTSNLESAISDEPLATCKGNKVAKKYSIHVHSKRKRLADPDNISAKAAIDGLRKAGILPDDSAKFIKEVTYSQEIGKEDETIIMVSDAI